MAPAVQEVMWRAVWGSLAVMCPAGWCSPGDFWPLSWGRGSGNLGFRGPARSSLGLLSLGDFLTRRSGELTWLAQAVPWLGLVARATIGKQGNSLC